MLKEKQKERMKGEYVCVLRVCLCEICGREERKDERKTERKSEKTK